VSSTTETPVCLHDQERAHWYDPHNASFNGSHIVFEMENLPSDKWMRYCAGPRRSWMFEAWRSQLEGQMEHMPPFRSLLVGNNDLEDSRIITIDTARDLLSEFVPLGWVAEFGERWYNTPIYNAVVDELGFDPLWQRDVRNRSLP